MIEQAYLWIADAIDGDCDLEPEPREESCDDEGALDEQEWEGASCGFLHRDGRWRGSAA